MSALRSMSELEFNSWLDSIVGAEGSMGGMLWLAARTTFNARVADVLGIDVGPDHQRKGHGTRARQALEGEVQELGLAGIALLVFGHGAGAQARSGGLSFQPTDIRLCKPVASAGV